MTIPEIPGLEIPNIDALTRDQVRDLHLLFEWLSHYCNMKERAMYYRANGEVNGALLLEESCDLLYRDLPEWVRW